MQLYTSPLLLQSIPKLKTFSLPPHIFPNRFSPLQTLYFHTKTPSYPLNSSLRQQNYDEEEEEEDDFVIGDCLVFEEGAFEDPFVESLSDSMSLIEKKKGGLGSEIEDLVPQEWKEVREEINITKKERRRLAREMEFGRNVQKRLQRLAPLNNPNSPHVVAYRNEKLAQLSPVVLDKPTSFLVVDQEDKTRDSDGDDGELGRSERVAPRNPRLAVYGRGLDDVTEFFNSGAYDPNAVKKPGVGRRKLFTQEEKVQMNRRIPDLADATCAKWLPLHTLVASGEFYLMDALLKHNVDINVKDKDGLTALHKATLSKKQAIFNYLLRESANPFACDNDGATLMHYAVRSASSQMIKILLLYNVDINLKDNDGWTPLHLAVQTRRTDIVRLLLIKGADKTQKNNDGLTPLELCLYLGRDSRTYELIKLLKLPPKPRQLGQLSTSV